MTAGLDAADGDAAVIIDVDLQDPPELIGEFLQKWEEGYHIVYGRRVDRSQDSWAKRLTSSLFYRFFNRISKIKIPYNAGDFRLLDQKVIHEIRQLREKTRFMKGLYHWIGYSSVGVDFARQPRAAGTTKWNYWSLWLFALGGIIDFTTAPLTLWIYFGGMIAFSGFLYAAIIIAKVLFTGIDIPGYASLLCVVLFTSGVQILSIGIIGQYVAKLFTESKNRPIYLVKETIPAQSKS